jgi:hypothetical protein
VRVNADDASFTVLAGYAHVIAKFQFCLGGFVVWHTPTVHRRLGAS